jgi:hypothetical protein
LGRGGEGARPLLPPAAIKVKTDFKKKGGRRRTERQNKFRHGRRRRGKMIETKR